MKNKKLLLCNILLIVGLIFKFNIYRNENEESLKPKVEKKNLLSMNLEQTAGVGDYKTVSRSEWPTEGYIFNSELSRCENGSEISWDDTKKVVVVSGNLSDKCYVDFDIYQPTTLAEYVISQYTGTQGDNSLYYHDSSLANGAGDNSYRYAGANPNNFVCFGSDASPCPEDNLYRIIGVFDGKIKLIKYTEASTSLLGTDGDYKYYSLYHWNRSLCPSSKTGYINGNSNSILFMSNKDNSLAAGDVTNDGGCNIWNYSDLNKINLNTNYLNNIGTKWSKMIENSVWRISGYNTSSVIPSVMHNAEITNATKTYEPSDGTSKIGLIYVSDFGFAASPSTWTTTMDNYKNFNDVNWLSSISTWTITPNSSEIGAVFSIDAGTILFTGNVAGTEQSNVVYPVFYLLTSVAYVSGFGASSDPIRIN